MAKAKIWYKHIKPGDVVEVKLAKDHCWAWDGGKTYQVTVKEISASNIYGNFYRPNDPNKHFIVVAWGKCGIGEIFSGHKGSILRKIKQPKES